jgi:hypothetical protein
MSPKLWPQGLRYSRPDVRHWISGASLVTANWLACRETETGRFPCPGDGD